MKRKHFLIVLLLGLAAAAIYAIWYSPYDQPPTASSAGHAGKGRQTAARKSGAQELALKLELLDPQKDVFGEVERDIFNFYTPPPPPTPPPPVVRQPLPPPPPVVTAPAPVPSAPGIPAARFRFLGLLDKDDDRAVFLATGDELFIVRNGMRFGNDNQFLVEELSAEEVSIRQQGLSALIRVNLLEPDNNQTSIPSPSTRGYSSQGKMMGAGRPVPMRGQAAPASAAGQNVPISIGTPTGDNDEPTIRFEVPPIAKPRLKSFKRYQP